MASRACRRPGTTLHPIHHGRLLNALLATATIVVTLLFGEISIRLMGYRPWQERSPGRQGPVVFEPDSILGWRSLEGKFTFYADASGEPTTMTNWPNGFRATSPATRPDGQRKMRTLLFVGDSYTQGWGVSDWETFAWKIQGELPDWEVLNLGTGGYGTYQSLLSLERYYSRGRRADIVVYGFLAFHNERNAGTAEWFRTLAADSESGHVSLPYVSFGANDSLVYHPVTTYPQWPLARRLSIASAAQHAYAKLSLGSDDRFAELTKHLVQRMQSLASQHGSQFSVASLDLVRSTTALKNHGSEFRRMGMNLAPCAQEHSPDKIVRGDGHPNGETHSAYAVCILGALRKSAPRLFFDRMPSPIPWRHL